jgi:intein/homing endonuclease
MDARAKKISQTMRARHLDNFKQWRDRMKELGEIKSDYPVLKKDGDLAELIGITLGDGHIYRHPRCDSLRITGDSNKMGFVNRSTSLVEAVFGKKPTVLKVRRSNAMTVTIYEQNISKRLGIPHGSRKNLEYVLPKWISRSRPNIIRFLRGLYEAEGSLCYHPPTSTHKLFFANKNQHLLKLVAMLIENLGFKQNTYINKVQVSRKAEVQELKNLIQFRSY